MQSTAIPTAPLFYRLRFALEASRPIRLASHQAATVHALLAAAQGKSSGDDDALPDCMMPDAPEQCRGILLAGEPYALGCTILTDDPTYALRVCTAMTTGLRHLGELQGVRHPPPTFSGNFALLEVRDLVSSCELTGAAHPSSIPPDTIAQEQRRVRTLSRLTLRFTSPLRMQRVAADREPGHQWFDERFFDAGLFTLRLANRLAGLGLVDRPESAAPFYRGSKTAENRLLWLDVGYGPRSRRKVLGGAAGRVILDITSPEITDLLVLGQYARAGQATRFGFGAYRIEELGPDPYQCLRATPLFQTFTSDQAINACADELDLPSGELRQAARAIARGTYQPLPHTRIPIEQPGGKSRVLSIPAPRDRALQRAVLLRLAPALDQFFEESSLAYRHGLGRTRAAERLRQAFRDGYGYALKSDFRSFFDSINHAHLRDRLEVYLADDVAAAAIMAWVKAGAPFEDRGVPTGAPLSPLLANLFLDSFDEEVERDGGRLVRYADDFLILYRDRSDAQRVFDEAEAASSALLLTLNESKTRQIDLREPFEFLGFRFEMTERWTALPIDAPRRVEDLGWQQVVRRPEPQVEISLPGEADIATIDRGTWAVFGPGASVLRVRYEMLCCSYRAAAAETTVSFDSIRELLVLGGATMTAGVIDQLARHDIRVIIADDGGRPLTELSNQFADPDPHTAQSQLLAASDPLRRLAIARRLVAAKIANYATLARVRKAQLGPTLFTTLSDHSLRARGAESVERLLGIEGSAAARWYGALVKAAPTWCRFERRVAPDAEDPVNILLNLAQSYLHRQILLAIRLAGLMPSAGVLHEPRSGHAALASDLQEPFRHLMDRVVLTVLPTLKPSDFRPVESGPFRVVIAPQALRRVIAAVHAALVQPCVAASRPEAFTYLTHIILSARNLKRHMLDRSIVFEPFMHQESS